MTMDVIDAIEGRQSIRSFDPQRPVGKPVIEAILATAARAPSGSNIQPWHVWVVQGALRQRISDACEKRFLAGDEGEAAYHYYPQEWRQPYLGRRRETGFGLYGLLGINRKDASAVEAYRVRNYRFFDAPVGLFFTIDSDMELGSWLDYGMFLQSIMLAARTHGLETCPQAAFCAYHDSIMPLLGAPDSQMLVCGMSLGYACEDASVNGYRTSRLAVEDYVTFLPAD